MGTHTLKPVVILGGGPAGFAVAIHCRRLSLPVVLLEREKHLTSKPGEILHPEIELQLTKEFEDRVEELEKEKSKLQEELKKTGQQPTIDADLLLRESNFYFEKKDFKKTLGLADAVLAYNSSIEDAWFNRGFALGELGRYEEGIQSYDKSLDITPNIDFIWYNRGLSLFHLGHMRFLILAFFLACLMI